MKPLSHLVPSVVVGGGGVVAVVSDVCPHAAPAHVVLLRLDLRVQHCNIIMILLIALNFIFEGGGNTVPGFIPQV